MINLILAYGPSTLLPAVVDVPARCVQARGGADVNHEMDRSRS